jgi:hypothetical protein
MTVQSEILTGLLNKTLLNITLKLIYFNTKSCACFPQSLLMRFVLFAEGKATFPERALTDWPL